MARKLIVTAYPKTKKARQCPARFVPYEEVFTVNQIFIYFLIGVRPIDSVHLYIIIF